MTAEEIFNKVKPVFDDYDVADAKEALEQMGMHGLRDVLEKHNWGYYQFLPCLIKVLGCKQIVELGGSVGTGCLMMLSAMPQDSMLYSINLKAGTGVNFDYEFGYIKRDYPNLVKVIGDDLDLSNWPKDLDWSKTDLLFIDTEHNLEQVTKELDLYYPLLNKGTLILFDDIHINSEMVEVWNRIKCDKFDASKWLHWTGFGLATKDIDNWGGER